MVKVKHFLYYNMSEKRKLGRPALPKGQRKQPFPMRITPAQLAQFEKAAKEKRLPLRDWITSTLTEAAEKIP